MKPMNRKELIERIAQETDMRKRDVIQVVDAMTRVIAGEIGWGGSVRLIDFGAFSAPETKARAGRNPKTGEPIKIAARRRVKFTASKTLKEVCNPVRLTGARRRA